MSRNSGTHFLNLWAYNRFRSLASRRSDSSISDTESIQSSQTEEQGDLSLGIFLNLSAYNRFRSLVSRRSDSSISDAESLQSSHAAEQGSTGDCIPIPRTESEILLSPNLKAFSFNDLKSATSNFSPDSLIGEGGFGCVFKGWIDEQTFTASRPGVGVVVAVNNLKPEGLQGHNEWLAEVRYLGQLHHPNLVKLIGFCSDSDNRLLVNEFMPRGSLEIHLFQRRAQALSWATRIKVAIGAAKGLAFLHDAVSQVIYRGVKSSDILLDSDFNAKLSYFPLAQPGDMRHVMRRALRLVVDELELGILWKNNWIQTSHIGDFWDMVNVSVRGTRGYVAPEYIATGHLSAKTDVYNFGIVLLELLSGRRAYDVSRSVTEQILVDWAKPCLSDKRKLFRIVDPKLEGQFLKEEAYAMAKLVSVCIANDPKLRPRMSEVLALLEKLQGP